jgi:hypothetical protein
MFCSVIKFWVWCPSQTYSRPPTMMDGTVGVKPQINSNNAFTSKFNTTLKSKHINYHINTEIILFLPLSMEMRKSCSNPMRDSNRTKNVSNRSYRGKQNTHIMSNAHFPKSLAI